jgi:hypothetical protein
MGLGAERRVGSDRVVVSVVGPALTLGGRPGEQADLSRVGFLLRGGEVKVRIDPKARQRVNGRLRELTARNWGVSTRPEPVKPGETLGVGF